MGGLNTSLQIGLKALEATQGALSATSNNIANANTPGYTREVVQFSESPESLSVSGVLGGGVNLDNVQSVRDEILNLQIQQQTSGQSSADTQLAALQQVETYFTSTGQDVASAITAFSKSLNQLSAEPANASVQQGVISSGQNLAYAFNQTANGLAGARSDADSQVTQTVAQINTLTSQIAELNAQLSSQSATGKDGGTVQDQRDQLVLQLSKLTGIAISQSSDGETITTANGSPLVVGSKSYSLQTSAASDGTHHVLDANGNDITSSVQGGQLGGAIQLRDQTLPGFQSQLDTLASQFAAAFNSAQAMGFDSKGNPGTDFFSIPAGGQGAAAGLSVALSDPSGIAVSSDGSAGSNGNVANLTAALTQPLPSGSSVSDGYANLVYKVGTAGANASAQSSAIGQHLLQLTNQQGSVSGVNIDEETTNLIRFQTAYEAAARIVSTIQHLNSVTINMVS